VCEELDEMKVTYQASHRVWLVRPIKYRQSWIEFSKVAFCSISFAS